MRTKFELNVDRARTALGDLDVLAREEIPNLGSLLHALGARYSAPLVSEHYDVAEPANVARAARTNLTKLTADQHYIRGFGVSDSNVMEYSLSQLTSACLAFTLRQPVGEAMRDSLTHSIDAYLASGLARDGWAGSARR